MHAWGKYALRRHAVVQGEACTQEPGGHPTCTTTSMKSVADCSRLGGSCTKIGSAVSGTFSAMARNSTLCGNQEANGPSTLWLGVTSRSVQSNCVVTRTRYHTDVITQADALLLLDDQRYCVLLAAAAMRPDINSPGSPASACCWTALWIRWTPSGRGG